MLRRHSKALHEACPEGYISDYDTEVAWWFCNKGANPDRYWPFAYCQNGSQPKRIVDRGSWIADRGVALALGIMKKEYYLQPRMRMRPHQGETGLRPGPVMLYLILSMWIFEMKLIQYYYYGGSSLYTKLRF